MGLEIPEVCHLNVAVVKANIVPGICRQGRDLRCAVFLEIPDPVQDHHHLWNREGSLGIRCV